MKTKIKSHIPQQNQTVKTSQGRGKLQKSGEKLDKSVDSQSGQDKLVSRTLVEKPCECKVIHPAPRKGLTFKPIENSTNKKRGFINGNSSIIDADTPQKNKLISKTLI